MTVFVGSITYAVVIPLDALQDRHFVKPVENP